MDELLAPYGNHEFTTRARKVMTSGNTRATLFVPPTPPYAVVGKGCHVIDQLDHEVIDFNNNYTAMIHGHSFEPINDVVRDQLSKGTAFGLPTFSEVELAEVLAARTSIPFWRFNNSGTEAVMTAIRGARAFTKRDVIVRFAGSYHGVHETVVDSTAAGIPSSTQDVAIALPQGDVEAFDACMREHGRSVAAVLIDLMPNRAGLIPAQQDFITHVAETTRKHGALLIVDEVITFRVGLGGMHKHYGITPDIMTVGKIMGGGFPVGGLGGNADVMSVFDPATSGTVSLGGTFSANPVTMRAGKVAMDYFNTAEIERLNGLGENFRTQLTEAGIKVTGFGSLARLHEPVNVAELWWTMYHNHVLTGTSTLMSLSTPMGQDDVDRAVTGIVDSVKALRT